MIRFDARIGALTRRVPDIISNDGALMCPHVQYHLPQGDIAHSDPASYGAGANGYYDPQGLPLIPRSLEPGRSIELSRSRRHGVRQVLRLYRPFALHGHAGAGAGVRPVIPHRAVLGAAVVPERNCVLGPAEAALEQRVLGVLVEIGQHRIALVARDADDEAGEAAIDVE
ncbi:hypothetical protein SB7C_12195, partial [Staphylococcus epidermidis]